MTCQPVEQRGTSSVRSRRSRARRWRRPRRWAPAGLRRGRRVPGALGHGGSSVLRGRGDRSPAPGTSTTPRPGCAAGSAGPVARGRRARACAAARGWGVDLAEPPGVAADRRLEHVADVAGVAERSALDLRQQVAQPASSTPASRRTRRPEAITSKIVDELVVGVVGEVDRVRNRLSRPGFWRDEDRHRAGVAGDDDDEVVAVVLHLLDEGVDRLLAVLVAGQRVGLVDEEHAADGGLHDLGRLHRGLADVAGDELGAVDLDELALESRPSAR